MPPHQRSGREHPAPGSVLATPRGTVREPQTPRLTRSVPPSLPAPPSASAACAAKIANGLKPCPAAIRPLVEQLAELKELIQSQIEHTLGDLQAENDELHLRLAALERPSSSALPLVKEPKLVGNDTCEVIAGYVQKAGDATETKAIGRGIGCLPEEDLKEGVYVRFQNLKSRPDLNGEKGVLLEFDNEIGRWKVCLGDGAGICVKPENVYHSVEDDCIPVGQGHPGDVRQFMQRFLEEQTAIVQQALDDSSRNTMRVLAANYKAYLEAAESFGKGPVVENIYPSNATESSCEHEIPAAPQARKFKSHFQPGNMNYSSENSNTDAECAALAAAHLRHSKHGGHMKIPKELAGVDGKKDCMKQCLFADATAMKDRVREAITKKPYSVMDFYWEEGLAQRIARSAQFDQFTLCVIALNALWIAVDTEFNRSDVLVNADPVFVWAENLFCAYFFFEWLTRYCAFKRKIDALKDRWFLFDSTLALFMVSETWVMTIVIWTMGGKGDGGLGDASILRLVRLMRLTRMARMARLLRAMPELMILVKAIFVAFRSVFFTICLLMLIIYVFAICFVQLTNSTENSVRTDYFSGVLPAMWTLLLVGNMPDHSPFVQQVAHENVLWGAVLGVFLFLGPLTIMGMLAGVLVEVVSVVSAVERETLVVNYVTEQLHRMLNDVDLDGDSCLTREEFQRLVVRPDSARMMASVGVDVIGLAEFCDFLFADSEEITFANFMELVLQLRGTNQATVKDIVDMRKFMRQELSDLVLTAMESVETRLKNHVTQASTKLMAKIRDH